MKIASAVGKTLLLLWVGLLVTAAILQLDYSINRNLFNSGLLGLLFGNKEPTPIFSQPAMVCFVFGFVLWLVGVMVLLTDKRRRRGPPPLPRKSGESSLKNENVVAASSFERETPA